MEDNGPEHIPPYEPTPNVAPPPPPSAPSAPPTSGFGTVTPGAQPIDPYAQGGFNTPGSPGGFQPPEKKSRLGLILGIVGVLFLLFVIGLIAIFVLLARNIDVDDLAAGLGEPELEDTVEVSFEDGGEIQFDGQLGGGGFDLYEVTLSEGQVVQVTALRGDSAVDPILTVRHPDGSELARNDDAVSADLPSSFDSQVRFTADESGTYSVELSEFGNTDSGSYQIIIEEG